MNGQTAMDSTATEANMTQMLIAEILILIPEKVIVFTITM